ncbi:hypothetical protein [Bombella mellum]|uniref:DGQHR domain-containing protein n=1 Tax=Bombella mellum TaxID=2039288 RepID=A0ABR5ZQH5_9PROT|nr:hypothetical protein [Bombella mellum]MBA5726554.1 hypothetical protein [Bombella mellum]
MNLEILDTFQEEGATCRLCKTSLEEYISNLPDDFQEFDIQRSLVQNHFLDKIFSTLLKKQHIPLIVLVSEDLVNEDDVKQEAGVTSFKLSKNFKILDGLQRSHRLKEIWDTISFIKEDFKDDDKKLTVVQASRKISKTLRSKKIDPSIFRKVLKEYRKNSSEIIKLFDGNNIWLEVWFSLKRDDQIKKMLVLNAGHKSVNIKHQIELLFLNQLDTLKGKIGEKGEIFREKDKSSIQYSKERKKGQYHFSHLISAFVSLLEGRPVTTNAEYSAAHAFSDETEFNSYLSDVDADILNSFVEAITSLDKGSPSDKEVRWFGREVVLSGIFGAIGAVAKKKNTDSPKEDILSTITNFVDTHTLPRFFKNLNVEGFEEWRNQQNLSSINIGNKNKSKVFEATRQFLEGKIDSEIDWANVKEIEK